MGTTNHSMRHAMRHPISRPVARPITGESSGGGAPSNLPGVPRNFDVEVEDGDFLLSWLAPLSDGGSPITEYFIEFKLSSDSAWDHWDSVSDSPTIANGLTPGESYDWRVAAINANGQGPFTAPVTATFPGGAPLSLVGTAIVGTSLVG